MPQAPLTRVSLLIRMRNAGDGEAWREFSAIYGPVIYGYARRRGVQEADAEDLVQEVLRAVVANADSLEAVSRKGSFRKWLFTLAHHKLYDLRQRLKRQALGSGDTAIAELLEQQPAPGDDLADWEQEFERRLFLWAAEQVRPRLAESTWQAFWLTAVDGQAAADVARQLSLTTAAVYLAKSRVMAQLRKRIEEFEGE